MKKKLLMVLISVSMIASVFTGCGNSAETKDSGKAQTEQAATKEDSADKTDEEQAALDLDEKEVINGINFCFYDRICIYRMWK